MAPRWWLLILCLTASVHHTRTQPDSKGFISIDCGLQGEESYVDEETKLVYVSDAAFTDTGTPYNISAEYFRPWGSRNVRSLRSFPDGVRNCYTLRSLVSGLKYIFRATFLYGNYDGLNQRPVSFDLYIGVNFWTVVNMSWWGSGQDSMGTLEAIVVVPHDLVQVCLINTGEGTPFISGLELRPLKMSLYPQATAEVGLLLRSRRNYAPINETTMRYPDDPYDRLWIPWSRATDWAAMSTTARVDSVDVDYFEAPMAVLQTAVTPLNASGSITFGWNAQPQPNNPLPGYLTVLHFVELQLLDRDAVRQFNITLNDESRFPGPTYTYTPPGYLNRGCVYNSFPYPRGSTYIFTIKATTNSMLPPILNAFEVFSVIPTTNVGTDIQDASAAMAIKAKYKVQKNWMGDPCFPKTMAWDSMNCSYATAGPPRITTINLSSNGLDGDISSSFANLKALKYLNLSNNNLTGSIPDVLSQLQSLTDIDLSDNQLNGSIPYGLLKRIQDGSLNLRHSNNPNLCTEDNSCQLVAKRKNKLAIYVVVPLLVIVVIVSMATLVLFLLRRRKKQKGSMNNMVTIKPQNEEEMRTSHGGANDSLRLVENRRFTYKELEMITNGFERVLGQGGFGRVYDGFLEDGTQVAVKLRSHSSNQGIKEFLAEAQILTRIHHKNLVAMIGYCKDGEYMALVYEYMSQGTLQMHIAGIHESLPWRQRLRIALESAQGLEYLHKGCNPPLIHRDVKSTNILLNARLEAKIADFGLSKAFDYYNENYISTNTIVGTPGYVDPEYQATVQPTTKSDVYSFGVVLLELVTGKPVILSDPEPKSIIHWVRQRLARGNIEGVVDVRMHDGYNVNVVWKVAEIALKCTAHTSVHRPTMADVVAQLQECVELEEGPTRDVNTCDSNNDYSRWNYNAYASGKSTDVSRNAAFQTELRMPTVDLGLAPATR
ncbi:putative leucine-rich repeat receptor-like serine/threonine-protein kinase At2g19230 isoform X1 [Hordeum vulgare subsp. vulgare]|uniref:non-specific serine/threonine protein kinase n=1 Tax=Hordeum vulgare subsp. vulgare TaxID=112509 RepID=A0A8I6X195_HORVV|nr:putative leucine-rich repeat receptor-like serine/threonine-protein kinase At2g19230 isoform X1 [Hordeum vulgare subsp. vulgare]